MSTAPDEVFSLAYWVNDDDGQPIVGFMIGYVGPVEEGARVLRPFREFGEPISDEIHPQRYTELQSILDDVNPWDLQIYYKSNFLRELTDDAIDVILEYCNELPVVPSHGFIECLGGAVNRVDRNATAFNHRDGLVQLHHALDVARPRGQRADHRVDAQIRRRDAALVHGGCVRELPGHRGGGPRQGGLRA